MTLPIVPDSCEGCGACCMSMMSPPFDSDEEYDAMPEWLRVELEASPMQPGPCCWLDLETRRCKHYEHRPLICREFERGNPICLDDLQIHAEACK